MGISVSKHLLQKRRFGYTTEVFDPKIFDTKAKAFDTKQKIFDAKQTTRIKVEFRYL